jgi:ubiquinone/menaquinone biosynthesis C-methylase UbiE
MATPEDVKARVASAYNRAADFYDHAGNAFWERFGSQTVERLQLPGGDQILDLCCGSGASALPAAQAVGPGGRVVGVDLADELLRLAREKAAARDLTNVEFRQGDVMALDFPRASFDAVICVFGVFFIPDMAAAMGEMWSFVRPGGRLAITTWGQGLFEPANDAFWRAVQSVRPDLYKSFNPWDRLGEPRLVEELFQSTGARPSVTLERASHVIRDEADVDALLLGTGYRGTMEQLSAGDQAIVRASVVTAIRASTTPEINTDVIYAVALKNS